MLFSEIVKKAGGYSLVGKYFDDNLEVFEGYLESLRSVKEVDELIQLYIADYNQLCCLAEEHKEGLNRIIIKIKKTTHYPGDEVINLPY